jgi:hypothetical protein
MLISRGLIAATRVKRDDSLDLDAIRFDVPVGNKSVFPTGLAFVSVRQIKQMFPGVAQAPTWATESVDEQRQLHRTFIGSIERGEGDVRLTEHLAIWGRGRSSDGALGDFWPAPKIADAAVSYFIDRTASQSIL